MLKKKIVVLGTGFGAFSCLKKLNKKYFNIKVVSPRNHFLFTPLLPSTTVGTIEFRSIIEPIRNLINITYYQAYCHSIDTKNKMVICRNIEKQNEIAVLQREQSRQNTAGFELPYDILIISVGEVTNTYNIEGAKENAYLLREVTDARKIRVKVIDCFEEASLPELALEEKKRYLRFIVCGGGPTGVEFAAELHDFIEKDVKRKYPQLMRLIEIILIEAEETILNSFDEKLREYTSKIFRRENINIKVNSYITKVTERTIYLNDGSNLDFGLLVWATGNTATEFVKRSKLPLSIKDKIISDGFLRAKGYGDIYVIGDCSEGENISYPVTAQVAQQQGKYLGKSLNKRAKNKKIKPFRFRNFGMLAYVGERKALADTPQFKGTGFKTFLFWRSVYLTKLVSLKNKILVLFDWFKTFVFGRDVSNF